MTQLEYFCAVWNQIFIWVRNTSITWLLGSWVQKKEEKTPKKKRKCIETRFNKPHFQHKAEMMVPAAISPLVSDQRRAASASPAPPPAMAPVHPLAPGNQLRKGRVVVIQFFPLLVHVEIHPCPRKPFPGLDARGHESGALAGAGWPNPND